MLNHEPQYNWLLSGGLRRSSVLGRPARWRRPFAKRELNVFDEDADEAAPSQETKERIHESLDALQSGDVAAAGEMTKAVIESWRADNSAGGKGVHEHLPLPSNFAKAMARLLGGGHAEDQSAAFDGVIERITPSDRTLVSQQLAELIERPYSGIGDQMPSPMPNARAEPSNRPLVRADVPGMQSRLDEQKENEVLLPQRVDLSRDHVLEWKMHESGDDASLRGDEERVGEAALRTMDYRPAKDGVAWRALPYSPPDTPAPMREARWEDGEGNIVYEAWELPDGTMPAPHPAYNKVLPVQSSSIPSRQHPPGYSSGEYDPTAVGLRKDYDPATGKMVYKPHHGIDFRATRGQAARVAADGVVVAIVQNAGGYGNLVAVRHPDGTMTLYAHLESRVPVRMGDYVRAGTVIGYAGTSGNASKPQVHFEIWRQAYLTSPGVLDYKRGHQNLIDPYKWFDRPMTGPNPRPKPAVR